MKRPGRQCAVFPDGGGAPPAATAETLKTLVDQAVEKKALSVAEEMRVRENKKPTMKVFADQLELSDRQREALEREVIRGQAEVFGLLRTPTEDGTNLLDELVETYAESLANPGEDPGWAGWFGRVLTERIPGSSDTYATRIEAVKSSMRKTFREIFSEQQYAEYEKWGVDPIEFREIEGSPGDALGERIVERARALGAAIPRKEGE